MQFSTSFRSSVVGALFLTLSLPAAARAIPPGLSSGRRGDDVSIRDLRAAHEKIFPAVIPRDVPEVADRINYADYLDEASAGYDDAYADFADDDNANYAGADDDGYASASLLNRRMNRFNVKGGSGGRRDPTVLQGGAKDGKVDVKYVQSQGAPAAPKKMIGDAYSSSTGKGLDTLKKVKFSDVNNPNQMGATKEAMGAAGKSGSSRHVFQPGQPGWDQVKGGKLAQLGSKAKGGQTPGSIKVKNYSHDMGDHDLTVKFP